MKNISPFIKKIKTENGYYIYDVFKNDILTVDNTTYDIIEDFYNLSKTELIAKYNKNYNIEKLENRWKIIEKKITQGYFSNERPNLNTNYSLLEDEEIRCRMFKSLILIATHDCNLRCKYCAYSGKYFYYRTHANRKMSIATAQKAINLLKIPEKYKKINKTFFINFYGGEPLLNFELIRFCKEYTDQRKRQTGEKFAFVIETNGTLLTPKVADFLTKSNIFCAVSLDGPKEIHDKYRAYKNGKGSYNTIIKNLHYLKRHYPQYYDSISFNMVFHPPFHEQMTEFFADNIDLFYNNRIHFNLVDPYDNNFINKNDINIRDKYLDNMRERFVQAMIKDENNTDYFLKSYFSNSLKKSLSFMSGIKNNKNLERTICLIGGQRVTVDVDGSLTHCIGFCDNGIKLGDVENGLDIRLINELMEQYCDLILPYCRNCWLIRHCPLCQYSFLKGKNFSEERRKEKCDLIRKKYYKDIQMTLTILEKNPKALDYIQKFKTLKDII
jgi:uncharacterized protein